MKKAFTTIVLAISVIISASAQPTQSGYVKTKGRMDSKGQLIPGTRIGGAAITLAGGHSTVADANGNFKLTVPDKKYYLQNVQKQGYVLVDPDVLSKQYVQSVNPLVITMETPDKQLEDQLKSERKLRKQLQKQLQQREEEIDSLKENNIITAEEYRAALQKLYADQESNEKLISDMAKRYAEIDYDLLDEFYRQVTFCIENGDLVKADSLLRSRGDVVQQVKDVHEKSQAINEEKEKIRQAETVLAADIEELARRCYSYYEKFSAQYRNDSAAYYLELRAGLDTTNVEWQLETAVLLDSIGHYDEAIFYAYRALQQCTGEKSLMESLSMATTGIVYFHNHDTIISIKYLQDALDILLERNNQDETKYIAHIYFYIAKVLTERHEYIHSFEYYQKALAIYLSVFGEIAPITAQVYYDMGKTYYKIGDYAKVLECQERALSIEKAYYGENNPNVQYNFTGTVYYNQENYTKALEYFEKALSVAEICYGKNHPEVAQSYNNIANIYIYQGNYLKAMENFEEAIAIYKNYYGENYYKMADCYSGIGGIYEHQGEYIKALEFHEKALAISKKYENHFKVGIRYYNIGLVYYNLKMYSISLEFFEQALNDWKTFFQEDHPYLVKAYISIADVYSNQNNYSKTLEYCSKALSILKSHSGESRIDMAYCYFMIGHIFYNQRDYSSAKDYLEKALSIYIADSDENHIEVAQCYNWIGHIFYNQGDYSSAIDYYKNALHNFMANFGENHIKVAQCYNWIGCSFCNQRDYSSAKDYLEKALSIYLANSGENHLDVAYCYNWIGYAFYNQSDYSKAIDYLKKASSIYLANFGENHPDVASVYSRIGAAYFKLREYSKALEYHELALAYWKTNYGEDYPDTKVEMGNIENARMGMIIFDSVSMRQYIFIATIVDGETPAKAQGLSGEYVVLELGDWSIDSTSSLYDVNEEMRGEPKTILIMKDDVISQHSFENTIGAMIKLKQVGEAEKNRIKELYHRWKSESNR